MVSASALRVVFAGTPDFAAHYLKFLLNNSAFSENKDQIVGVYTQPDRPAGRGKQLQASPVKKLALENELQIFQPENFKSEEARRQLRDLNPDLMIVVAYGLILPEAVLNTPRLGCINIHASLLPRWRGAAPIQRAIEAGDAKSGITIMQMDVGLDTGDMLVTEECAISSVDTAGSLHDKLLAAGEPALAQTLQQLRSGQINPIKQDDSASTYAPKITKQEAAVDWTESGDIIERKIRAFYPFPIAYTQIGSHRIRIYEAFVLAENKALDAVLGTILAATEQGLDVKTADGAIRIKKLQLPGKKVLPIADVLRGNSDLFPVGAKFE